MPSGLPTSSTNTAPSFGSASGAGSVISGGALSQGAAAAGAGAAPAPTKTPVSQPPTATTPSTPATASGTGSSPPLSSYYPGSPTPTNYSATAASASDTGAAPVANASDVNQMAGINNGQINPNDPTNSASQLDAITNANSPYIQLAKQQGLLSAAQRGLTNSSIGAGASEAAAVQAAAPLAQQNASTAASGQLQNSQLNTQANEFNAANTEANQQLNAQLATQTSQFNAGNTTAAAAANAAAANQMKSQTQAIIGQLNNTALGSAGAQALANIQGKWNNLIQSNASAGQMYNNMLNGITTIMNNKDLAPNKVQDMINMETNLFDGAMKVMDSISGGTTPAPMAAPTATAPTATTPRAATGPVK